MRTVYVDYETYYSKEYTLRKMTPVEYILDPRFETIGVAVAEDEGEPHWVDGPDFAGWLRDAKLEECVVVSHNALFDMCILSWRYGVVPKLMVDTLGMARAKLAHALPSLSLASIATHFGIGVKGDAILKVVGMGRDAMIDAGLYEPLSQYALNDVDLCRQIYKRLQPFPVNELIILDMVLRCAVEPRVTLDSNVLSEHLAHIKASKEQLLFSAGLTSRDDLMSNEKFAEALRQLGVDPPVKTSLITGKTTWAFSKLDHEFIALEEHENPQVQALVSARLGLKTTLEESRTEKFLRIAALNWGENKCAIMPIPLRYSGAHTHRLSGDWGINLQNLPRGGKLRDALVAPAGHSFVACDAAQIEARMVAWFCSQSNLVAQFAGGEDVYSSFASVVFGRKITKADKLERFIGKTCIAEGTLVVTDSGLVPIEQVTTDHLLWDGEEWVCHEGLVPKGSKLTLPLCGVWLTPDHRVLCGTQWKEAQSLEHDAASLSHALGTAAANWSSRDTFVASAVGSERSSSGATAGALNTRSTRRTSRTSRALAALFAQSKPRWQSAIGGMLKRCRMTPTALASSTASLRRSLAATATPAGCGNTTVGAGSSCIKSGGMTALPSCGTSKLFPVGTARITKWIASTWIAATSRGTSASLAAPTTPRTSGALPISNIASESLRRVSKVYDLGNAGPRHRFTVMSEAGPLIVHNCILGLGYGMGWQKFQVTVKIQSRNQLGQEIALDDAEAQRIVMVYRTTYPNIPATWRTLNNALQHIASKDEPLTLGPATAGVIAYKNRIKLPSGLDLNYRNLRYDNEQWVFDHGRVKGKKIFGGKLLENIIQALARIVVMDAALRLRRQMREQFNAYLAMQVHDELVYIVDDKHTNDVASLVIAQMSKAPAWAEGLPLSAEAGPGKTYGDAK